MDPQSNTRLLIDTEEHMTTEKKHRGLVLIHKCFGLPDWDADDLLYSDDDAKPSKKTPKKTQSPGKHLFFFPLDRSHTALISDAM